MLTALQYRFLKRFYPNGSDACSGAVYLGKSKLLTLLGRELYSQLPGRTVIDFGCGEGLEAIEMAQAGARVIGLDIREAVLEKARRHAETAGVSNDRCTFTTATTEPADIIISLDSFEHFADPAHILDIMGSLLGSQGQAFICFGPIWRHPHGGHLFSVFPWAHLLFSEKALIRWRSDIKKDGATRFSEVSGGLNQMTIRRFKEYVENSPFTFQSFETVPIRRLRLLHTPLTRECTTSVVRCCLVKRA